MQDCFRLHPDIYGSELEEDMDDDEMVVAAPASGEPLDPKADHPLPTDAMSTPPSSPAPPSPKTSRVSSPQDVPPTSIPPPASTEPHPPASEDHEVAKKRTEENEWDKVSKKEIKDSVRPIDETEALVPKEAHDARGR